MPINEEGNSKVKQAEIGLRRASRLFEMTQSLNAQYRRIMQNDKLTDAMKQVNSAPVLKNIYRKLEQMELMIHAERLAVAQEFHRLRALDKNTPLDQHPQLKALKEMSVKLQEFADVIQKHRIMLVATPAPENNPWLESAPLTPTQKPVVDKAGIQHFKETARTKGWTNASTEMDKYAKAMRVKATDVKASVTEDLSDEKYKRIFGEKPKDKSRHSYQDEENETPRSGPGRRRR